MPSLARHFHECNNAVLPGGRLALCVGGARVGWVEPGVAALISGFGTVTGDAVVVADGGLLRELGRIAAGAGFGRVRGEDFDVRARPGGAVLGTIDRGALPVFGIMAEGVHVNGLVRRADGLHMWIARRAADKALDPGKLDHIVAGGTPAGLTPWETLIKEAAEEAAIPAALAAKALGVGSVGYAMARAEGLRRDLLHIYDLDIPADFVPRAVDGEVESFELWPVGRVLATVRETEDFKFNVNLVLIDLFLRLGLVVGPEADELRKLQPSGGAAAMGISRASEPPG